MTTEKNEIGGVQSIVTETKNIILVEDSANSLVPLIKGPEYAFDTAYIKALIPNIEYQARTSKEYKAYVRYLKEDLDPKLDHCMVYSGMNDDAVPIEMHHGPIFTLFDYVEIILKYHFDKGIGFTSADISHLVMEEHRKNHVQVLMLSKGAHLAVHPKKKGIKAKFVDYRSAHGNIVEFLNTYHEGLMIKHISKMRNYFDEYEANTNEKDSFFDISITKWNNEIYST